MSTGTTITIVLPVDSAPPRQHALASGLALPRAGQGAIVDNGLWRSMPIATAALTARFAREGLTFAETMPFDHLSAVFAEQQAALVPLAGRVDAVIAGLGN